MKVDKSFLGLLLLAYVVCAGVIGIATAITAGPWGGSIYIAMLLWLATVNREMQE